MPTRDTLIFLLIAALLVASCSSSRQIVSKHDQNLDLLNEDIRGMPATVTTTWGRDFNTAGVTIGQDSTIFTKEAESTQITLNNTQIDHITIKPKATGVNWGLVTGLGMIGIGAGTATLSETSDNNSIASYLVDELNSTALILLPAVFIIPGVALVLTSQRPTTPERVITFR